MEGYLLKWTNYIRGWQQRWFVLKDGVLSYYNSQNDSINGDCKRSFKISMFDIIVNKSDSSRVDLILPNEQYLYLKASDYKERQKWLVALASQKAIYPMNSMPHMISGASASAAASGGGPGALDSSDSSEHKLPNMTGIYDSTHLLKIKQSELRFYCDLLTQQTHEVKNLLLQVSPSPQQSTISESSSMKQRTLSGESADAVTGSAGASGGGDHHNQPASTSSSSTIVAPSASLSVHSSSNNNNNNSDNMSGYISASSSFKSITPTSSTGHASGGSDSESAGTVGDRSSLATGAAAAAAAALSSSPPDRDDIVIHSSTTTATTAPNPNDPHRIVIIDEDFIKKLDDVSSNINMTCDMLMQIIRNLILLSNTSTNVGPEALKSLLASVATLEGNASGSPKSPKSADDSLKADLEQYKYHLYHPMYLNNQLSPYNTKNLPVQPSTSLPASSSSSSSAAAAVASRSTANQSHLYEHQHQHHSTKSINNLNTNLNSGLLLSTTTSLSSPSAASDSSTSCSTTRRTTRSATIGSTPTSPTTSILTLSSKETQTSSTSLKSTESTATIENGNSSKRKTTSSSSSSTSNSSSTSPTAQSEWQTSHPNVNFNLNTYKHYSVRSVRRIKTLSSGNNHGKSSRNSIIIPNVHYSLNSAFSSVMMAASDHNNNNNNHHRSIRSNSIRNCHIESIQETALVSVSTTESESENLDLSRRSYPSDDCNNNNKEHHNHHHQQQDIEIESSSSTQLIDTKDGTETMITAEAVSSGPYQTLTIIGETHERIIEDIIDNNNNSSQSSTSSDDVQLCSTFFEVFQHKFIEIELKESNGVPTERFLNCCSDIFSLFDNFGSTTFLPVKIDVYGNINKLRQKYSIDPDKYHTLQAIVQDEIDLKQTQVRNSATDALMWLMRAIWFMREFMRQFIQAYDPDMNECVYVSYQITLRAHHNWVVRSLFSLAMRSLPSKEDFLRGLALNPQDFLENKQRFHMKIVNDMKTVTEGIDRCADVIKEFYIKNNLEV